jgi:hypothetical protein
MKVDAEMIHFSAASSDFNLFKGTRMPVASAKVPAALVSGIICLMLGVAGGVVLGAFVDTGLGKQGPPEPGDTPPPKEATKGAPMPKGAGGGGGKGGGGGGKGKGGFGPSPKTQLTQLVGKLDTLTKKPLKVDLSAEQKKQIKDALADLESKEAITDDEARAKLDALHKILEPQQETLDAAGFRWPGAPNPPPADGPNPFTAGDAADRLKSLRETLGK